MGHARHADASVTSCSTRAELARGRPDEAARWADHAEAAAEGLRPGYGNWAGRPRPRARAAHFGQCWSSSWKGSRRSGGRGQRGSPRIVSGRSRTLAGRALAAADEPAQAVAELEVAEAELATCGRAALPR